MRLGLNMGYSGSALRIHMPLVQEADRLGFSSVWSAEAYGSDAVTTITWVAALTKQIGVGTAIMQIPARTPTLTATTWSSPRVSRSSIVCFLLAVCRPTWFAIGRRWQSSHRRPEAMRSGSRELPSKG